MESGDYIPPLRPPPEVDAVGSMPSVEPAMPMQPVQPVLPVQPVQPVQPVGTNGRTWHVYRDVRVIHYVFGVLEVLLTLRLVLRLFAANPDAAFSALIYGVTGPFVFPFQGVFPDPSSRGSVFELSTLLALIVYPLLAWGISRLVRLPRHRQPTTPV